MTSNNIATCTGYQQASLRATNMQDDQLRTVWCAISNGGLNDTKPNSLVNGVSVQDWIEIVYSEMNLRGFSV